MPSEGLRNMYEKLIDTQANTDIELRK